MKSQHVEHMTDMRKSQIFDLVDRAAGCCSRRKPLIEGFPFFGPLNDFPTEKDSLSGLPYVNVYLISSSSFTGHGVLSFILQSIFFLILLVLKIMLSLNILK